jgi:hypothetical protein
MSLNVNIQVIIVDLMWFLGYTEIILFGFEVLAAVVEKSSVFFDTMSYSLVKADRHVGGIYRPHLQS